MKSNVMYGAVSTYEDPERGRSKSFDLLQVDVTHEKGKRIMSLKSCPSVQQLGRDVGEDFLSIVQLSGTPYIELCHLPRLLLEHQDNGPFGITRRYSCMGEAERNSFEEFFQESLQRTTKLKGNAFEEHARGILEGRLD